ncbi:MAG: ribosome biogenesis GTP-binding protein YsxC [Acidobacteria bacterium]|nr:MAG: ribosome biogenesis GTP-binding protein YsxC [Acidobacteriota bacterium]
MKIEAEFVTSAAGAGDFPRDRLPEVALVGRSNVGKSSLINALVRKPVARTSAAPGKTRLANFYRVQRGISPPLYLVDLPGYGYARGGDMAAREFNRLAEAYFARAVEQPIAVVLLVDSRHPGLESDVDAWAWARSLPCPSAVIGTKVDKLTRTLRTRHARELESLFQQPVPLVSAVNGEGLDALWKKIANLPRQTAE